MHFRHAAAAFRRLGLTAIAGVTACVLAACGGSKPTAPADEFGFAVSTPLLTTNAGSMLGSSTGADVLGGRVFPSVFVIGPAGQMIPNRDLATAQFIPGINSSVQYTISEKAVYSDGVPVTCTDFLLAYKAGAMRGLFNSNLPLMNQIERLDCAPGAKHFTVVFKPGLGSRWRSLFGPGTVLPAHAVAKRAGLNEEQLVAALQASNSAALMPVAQVWRTGFDLDRFDPELQVSAGPYRLEGVAEGGAVRLIRNERFAGDKAATEKIVIWPKSADLTEKNMSKSVDVADLVDVGQVPWVNREDPSNRFKEERVVGHLTEQLVLGNSGVFATAEARRQFGACVDRVAVAKASSERAGVEVPPIATHLTTAGDPANAHLSGIIKEHMQTNMGEAEKLRGATVRVGYLGPNERHQAMVNSIKESCASAGITVVEVNDPKMGYEDLQRKQLTPAGVPIEVPGTIDALLIADDPHLGYSHVNGDLGDVEKLRAEEQQLWNESDVIPLAAQPRTLIYDKKIANIVVNTARSGIGWNLERWQEGSKP